MDRLIFMEEMVEAEAPLGYHLAGERQVGPSLILHGTPEQRELLKPIAAADICFCVGLSEPGAGSDLAGLETRADRRGDHYVVNGQKIWTSFAHQADYCWLAVRSNPSAPKHRGISLLIVDMRSPGITVRPLHNMSGDHSFNEVFFDEVRVPVVNRVGEEDRGWYVLAEHLAFERGGIERVGAGLSLYYALLAAVRGAALPECRRATLRLRLADLATELAIARLLVYRTVDLLEKGLDASAAAAMSKTYGTEWVQRLAQQAVVVAHTIGTPALRERAEQAYMYASAWTVGGGTSEIQRDIVAQRGLQLPRS